MWEQDRSQQGETTLCKQCGDSTVPMYFLSEGPFCAKHWLSLSTEYHQNQVSLQSLQDGACTTCGKHGPVLKFDAHGPYCVIHYLKATQEKYGSQRHGSART